MERSELELELGRLLNATTAATGVTARTFGELAHMGHDAQPAVPYLLASLDEITHSQVRLAVIFTLVRLIPSGQAKPLVWDEIQRLRRLPEERYVWMATFGIFGGLKPQAYLEQMFELAREVVDDEQRGVVIATLSYVPGFAKLDGLEPWLLSQLKLWDRNIDSYALKALRRMRADVSDDVLLPFLDHPVEQAREDARAMLKLNAKRRAKEAENRG